MSLVDYLLETRTPLQMAKEYASLAHQNAALLNRIKTLEVELFWATAITTKEQNERTV